MICIAFVIQLISNLINRIRARICYFYRSFTAAAAEEEKKQQWQQSLLKAIEYRRFFFLFFTSFCLEWQA